MDQALNQKIDAYIAENKEQLLQDIAALVAIDSVEGTPEEGAPFGAGPRAALDKTRCAAGGHHHGSGQRRAAGRGQRAVCGRLTKRGRFCRVKCR